MRQVTLVHNPEAGDARHRGSSLRKELARAGYEVSRTIHKDDVEEKLDDPEDLVVVAGGDGSVRRVALALAGRGVPLAILPVGTANNIAKSLGIRGSVAELAAGWAGACRRLLRVGTVGTATGTMRFVESVGTGVFAELIGRGRSEADGSIDRALLLLERIVGQRPARARRLLLDGRDVSGEYLLVEAMNIPLIGPNVPLAPEADSGDGQLDVVTVSERERSGLLEYLRARLTGGTAGLSLPVHRATRVTMDASAGDLHVDDDTWKSQQKKGSSTAGEQPVREATVALDEMAVEVLTHR